jgi:hypothetical protein
MADQPDQYDAAPRLADLFRDLHAKFGDNISLCASNISKSVVAVEVRARATYQLGQTLANIPELQDFRKLLANILGEIFADTIVSVYLAGCALDNPAKILGRRVLELGVSVVYLWDQPCQFYGWYGHDKDLSFQDMLEYIGSSSFRMFLEKDVGSVSTFDPVVASKLYRSLSNIVHGKMCTFESSLPDRFAYTRQGGEEYAQLIGAVQDFLLKLWESRFPSEFKGMRKLLPALDGVK